MLHYQVVGIMRNNMEKVLERDARLADLEDTSGTILTGLVGQDRKIHFYN